MPSWVDVSPPSRQPLILEEAWIISSLFIAQEDARLKFVLRDPERSALYRFQNSNLSTLTASFHHCTHPCDPSGRIASRSHLLHTQRCLSDIFTAGFSDYTSTVFQNTKALVCFQISLFSPFSQRLCRSVKHQEASHPAQPICGLYDLTSSAEFV